MSPNHPLAKNRGCFRFVSWALLLFGILCLGRLVWDLRLAVTGSIADGAITKITMRTSYGGSSGRRRDGESEESYRKRTNRASTSYDLLVRFTPQGGEPRDFQTVATFGHDAKVGDAVKVIYLPGDPGSAEIYSAKQVWLPMAVGFIVTTLCLGGGWFLRKLTKSMEVLG